IVAQVSRNPRLVWSVSAVPTYSRGASSLTAAENCAESATALIPQTSSNGMSATSVAPKSRPTTLAHVPDTTIAVLVTSVRPQRSAYFPPSQHPIAPLPTTANVTSAASPVTSASAARRACSLAAMNTAIQVHIAYNSHI